MKAIPGGPWRWLEDGTKAHDIGVGRHKVTGRFTSVRERLSIGGNWVEGPVHHPGARGQHAWTKAINEFRREFVTISVKDLRKGLRGK